MGYDKYKEFNDACAEKLEVFKSKSNVSPQLGKGWSRVSLEVHIVEALTYVDWISSETLAVAMVILRKTWGWQNKKAYTFGYDPIKTDRGMLALLPPTKSRKTIERCVDELESRNIIAVYRQAGKPSAYGFNKHYDTWIYDKELKGINQYAPCIDSGVGTDTEVGIDTNVGTLNAKNDGKAKGKNLNVAGNIDVPSFIDVTGNTGVVGLYTNK
jgi:hypothetical protein